MKTTKWWTARVSAIGFGAILILIGYLYLTGIQSSDRGPFAYFDALPGDGSPFSKGMALISREAAAGKSADDALKLATDAGFSCQRQTLQQLVNISGGEQAFEILEAKLKDNVEYGYTCRYKYGFWRNTWWVRFEANRGGSIVRLRVDVSE